MAKVVSPVWSSIRGSIAGTTYSTTPSGQIIARQRTRPTQPVSTYRTYIRNSFEEAVAQWAALSAARMAAWQAWATAHGIVKSGRHSMIAGYAYGKWLAHAYGATFTPYIFVPNFVSLPAVTSAPVTFDTAGQTGIAVEVKNTSGLAVLISVERSGPFGLGRNFWKGPWVPTDTLTHQSAAGASFTFKMAGLQKDAKYFMRVRAVTNDSSVGREGNVVIAPTILSTIAVQNP